MSKGVASCPVVGATSLPGDDAGPALRSAGGVKQPAEREGFQDHRYRKPLRALAELRLETRGHHWQKMTFVPPPAQS